MPPCAVRIIGLKYMYNPAVQVFVPAGKGNKFGIRQVRAKAGCILYTMSRDFCVTIDTFLHFTPRPATRASHGAFAFGMLCIRACCHRVDKKTHLGLQVVQVRQGTYWRIQIHAPIRHF
jgi:hypothetical protein